MSINLNGNKLIVTFKFNNAIVQAIRMVPGRKFNVAKKHWEVPVECVVDCVDLMRPHGITPTLPVVELYNAQKALQKAADEVKNTPEEQVEYLGTLPLMGYQRVGAKFMRIIPSPLVGDEPGLGKTLQTIAALEGVSGRILVLCPASLKYQWAEELDKWRENSHTVIDGTRDERARQWNADTRWHVANYELLLHDEIPDFDVIVCDEATRLSNPNTKTAKLLRALSSTKRIALTGTPVSNSPLDVFGIVDWLCPKYLGSYFSFVDRYCVKEQRFNRIVGFKNLEELAEKVQRIMIRRTRDTVLADLPPKTRIDVPFVMSNDERKFYDSIRLMILAELKDVSFDKSTLPMIPVKMLRLKQATDHPRLLGSSVESSKLVALKELLDPIIKSGEKAIVFTRFAEMAKILLNELAKYNPKMIIGKIDAVSRQQAVGEFSTEVGSGLIIMTEAGAYGLNLQAASYVIHYDLPWSIAKLEQREGRAHRKGQTKPVTVYSLIAKKSIDEYVAKVLYKKSAISAQILGEEDVHNILYE